ncbi:helix-turn-helix domain-containing protein [Neobacillus mesonae]|nr:helix-turn-helix domain-containing protein [Neobacillus mesonae]
MLIADDEILDLEGMREFIPWEELGLKLVNAVNNGFDGLEVIKNYPVDILVSDVHMPGMSGIELARAALTWNKELKLIFVSGYQDFHYVKEALSLHAYSYVLKPMDDMELISVLQKITMELDDQNKRIELDNVFSQAALESIESYFMGKRFKLSDHHPALSHLDTDGEEVFFGKPLDLLITYLLAHDKELVREQIVYLMEPVHKLNLISQLHFTVLSLLIKIDFYMRTKLAYPEGFIPLGEGDVEMIKSKKSLEELISWLTSHLLGLFDISNHPKLKHKKHAKVVSQMLAYVEEHLHLNVTLREVADELCFSPNYLGAIFKEETGKSYNEYIMNMRMEKARSLLKDPKMKVYEVADRVGYRYLPYFSKQFKETFGMTPIEYRRKA